MVISQRLSVWFGVPQGTVAYQSCSPMETFAVRDDLQTWHLALISIRTVGKLNRAALKELILLSHF
jgi:hypothetical protein